MAIKKFEFTDEVNSQGLRRIRALIDIPSLGVSKGNLGGFLEKEDNLSHEGSCWISDNACIEGNARIWGNARISGDARIEGDACIWGDARIEGDACIWGNARIEDDARIMGNARISDNAVISKAQDYLTVSPVGSENGILTVFRTSNSLSVTRGCFEGTLEAFEEAVKTEHKGTQHETKYLSLINYVKIHFGV